MTMNMNSIKQHNWRMTVVTDKMMHLYHRKWKELLEGAKNLEKG